MDLIQTLNKLFANRGEKPHGKLAGSSNKALLRRPDGRTEEQQREDPNTEFAARRLRNTGRLRTHARLGGAKLTPSSANTHVIVYCNTPGGLRCKKHKDGVPRIHRIQKDAYEAMKHLFVSKEG